MWRTSGTRVQSLVPLALLFLGGCGGGGGGDTATQPAPTVPTTLAFAISPQWYDRAPGLLTSTGTVSGAFTTLQAEGSFNRDTQATSLTSLNLVLALDPDPLSGTGTLALGVLMPAPLQWTGLARPTAGTFQFNVSGVALDFDRVNVQVNNLPGVTVQAFRLSDPVHGPASFTWSQFDALADAPGAPAYQQVALLGFDIWQFLFKRTALAYTSLETIVTQDAALQAQHTLTRTGTSLATLPGAALQVTWQDVAQPPEPGPGDSFRMVFTHWWVDEPGNDVDDLYEGTLQLTGYTETADGTGHLVGGDFEFQGMTGQETESGGLSGSTTATTGGFNLTLSWP